MPRLIRILAPLLLWGCAAAVPPPVAFRDPGAPIYSNAVFDPAVLTGDWVQVAGFGDGCAGGAVRFGAPVEAAVPTEADLCLPGGRAGFRGDAALVAAGRLVPAGADPALGQPWWIVWADVDGRTLAVGTPSGAFGFILNRGGPLPPDRLAAARAVLAFNGYDLGRLRVY